MSDLLRVITDSKEAEQAKEDAMREFIQAAQRKNIHVPDEYVDRWWKRERDSDL